MKKSVALFLILFGGFVLQISAQTLLVNDKIPEDLLITLKRQGGWGGNYSEINITSDGEISYQTQGGLPVVAQSSVWYINGKPEKPAKYLKPKLSEEKLKILISEFEKIQFFRFGKDFPQEDEKKHWSVTDEQTEIISIRINGQTKEVSNYLGDSLERTRLLKDLAERIRGAGVWNYENGEIPGNFEIWYRTTNLDKVERDFKINAKGKIVQTFFWEKASESAPKIYAAYPLKTKTVGKLSKQQLKQIMDEFEKAVFSTFKYSKLTQYSGCANEAGLNDAKRTHINVQINHVSQMYASLYENCNPSPETDAAKFEYINEVLTRLLKNYDALK